MPIIYTYPSITPSKADLILISDVSATNPTKATRKCTVGDLVSLVGALVPGGGTVTSVGLSGGTTGITITDTGENPIITAGTFTLDGVLVAANGGTGHASYDIGDILYASGATTLSKLTFASAPVGNGDVLTLAGGIPSWATPTTGTMSSWTLIGDSGSQTITDGNTVDIEGGTDITTAAVATDKVTVTHDANARTETPVTPAQLTHGATFDAITSVTTTATGHLTADTLTTYRLPAAAAGTVTSVGATNAMGVSSGITFVTNPIPITGAGTVDLSFTGAIGDIWFASTTSDVRLLNVGTSTSTPTGSVINQVLAVDSTGPDPIPAWTTKEITIQDESGNIETAPTLIDFTGAGVTATSTGAGLVRVDIPGGGGNGIYGGSGSLIVDPTTVTMATNDLTWAGENDTRILYDKVPRTSHVNSSFVVEVHQESDIPSPLAANTTYLVRGEVTLTTQKLVTNSGCSIIGVDRNRDKLIWTGEGPMLIITDVDFDLSDIWLSSTLPGSSLIQATNLNIAAAYNQGRNKILTITNCQIRNCYDVMDVTGFDLVDINNTLFFYVQAPIFGVRFASTSKIEISSCEFIRWFDETSLPTPAGYSTASMIEILANAEGASGIGAINISGCIIHPQQTQVGVNINTGSTTGFGTIAANTFINTGLTTGEVFLGDALTPVAGAYSEAECLNYDIFSNQGILNSVSGVVMTMTGNATVTALTLNTPVAVNTGGLAVSQANVRYTVSTAGRCTYNGSKQVYVSLHTSLSYNKQGAGIDDYEFQFFKNGVLLPGSATLVEAELNGAVGMVYGTLMSQNDYIEIYVENTSSNDDMLVTDWQVLIRE